MTSIRSKGMSKSKCASMSSSPLFTSDAELVVTTLPMSQVGCLRACAGVTFASCSLVKPLKGPPEAVRISFFTSLPEPERKHCASAECSESTGTICPGVASEVTSRPPTINDSLLASARVLPEVRELMVAFRPAEPVMPFTTTSALEASTRSAARSDPSTHEAGLSPNSTR